MTLTSLIKCLMCLLKVCFIDSTNTFSVVSICSYCYRGIKVVWFIGLLQRCSKSKQIRALLDKNKQIKDGPRENDYDHQLYLVKKTKPPFREPERRLLLAVAGRQCDSWWDVNLKWPKDPVFRICDSLHLLPTRRMREDADKKLVTVSNLASPLSEGHRGK